LFELGAQQTLCNFLVEFGIAKKLVSLIKMCLRKASSGFHVYDQRERTRGL